MSGTTRKTPEITQAMVDLYDEYTHVSLDRRGFIDALARLAGGAAAAATVATALAADRAAAQLIAEDDPRLKIEPDHIFAGASGQMRGYWAEPADRSAPLGGIVVVHENRGLNPHIQDVARRAALAGFVALAPDFLSGAGGTPEDEDAARTMIRALDREAAYADGAAATAYLRGRPETTERVGIVGFCWGGAMANQVAVRDPDLAAAVAYYGRQADAADAGAIRARLMLHYAELDDRINSGIDAYVAALTSAGAEHVVHMYPGTNHAFHNDTSAARYNKEAAELSWSRTIAFFEETLG